MHKEKRKVLTTEARAALIHKSSVNCSRQPVLPALFRILTVDFKLLREKSSNCFSVDESEWILFSILIKSVL
jgi:hypothetical protein